MGELAIVAPAYKWAEFPTGTGGSHIDDPYWDLIGVMAHGGFRAAVQIVHPDTVDTAYEDARRLKEEKGIRTLAVRTFHGSDLEQPEVRYAQFRTFLEYVCRLYGPEPVYVLFVNERRLEVKRVWSRKTKQLEPATMELVLDHNRDLRALCRLNSKLANLRVSSPTTNAYSGPEGLADLQAVKARAGEYDVWGANVYPHTESELAGEWSLPWHEAMAPCPVLVWEYNAHPDITDMNLRARLLRLLHAQVMASTALLGAWFVMKAEGHEHARQEYQPYQVTAALEILAGLQPPPPVEPPTPPQPPAEGDLGVLLKYAGPLGAKYPGVLLDWCNAGGLKNNLAAHLYGLGAETVDAAAMDLIVTELVSKANQVKGAWGTLRPFCLRR